MIMVDVVVPSVDKTYNFALNENVSVDTVVEEISEMIEQKEKITLVGNVSEFGLYDSDQKIALPKGNTLQECAIKNGSKLILV